MPRVTFNRHGALLDVADAQAGLITASQLMELGVPRSTVHRRTRPGGMWNRLLPSVHQLTSGEPTLLQREVAATLYAGSGAIITGLASLRHHGLMLQGDDPSRSLIQVLVPHERRVASSSFVRIERSRRLPDAERALAHPLLRTAPPSRAVADAARHLRDRGPIHTLVSESLRRGLTTVESLTRELREAPRQGSAHLRDVLALVDHGALSIPESDVLALVEEAGLPAPLLNRRLYTATGTFIAVPDGWFDEVGLAYEVDSERHHAFGADLDRTVQRNASYARAGVICLPIRPRDIRDRPSTVITALREAYTAAQARPRPAVMASPLSIRDDPATIPARWGG